MKKLIMKKNLKKGKKKHSKYKILGKQQEKNGKRD
jgi:hypothetical protein